ncbi:MAG: hypothetical protein WBJ45_01435 [Limnohabitans sp.]|uniref:hypothetical protein n=1 Tax=Limnohabitans sp. TaxID=1907725 RepID=UPI003BB1109F
MTSKIDLALELKGIAYDAYSSYESYKAGGPLKIAEVAANGTTFLTSIAGKIGVRSQLI